jgi:hypothetical protein
MKDDPEITAMATLKEVLSSLDEETRTHVIRWANDRFGVGPRKVENIEGEQYDELGNLFTAANPQTDQEKALVGGYWLQAVKGKENFESAAVNSGLKNLGHRVKNITRAFDDLQKQRPSKAIQTKKTGQQKQGRKKYKITQEGIQHVQKMLAESSKDA